MHAVTSSQTYYLLLTCYNTDYLSMYLVGIQLIDIEKKKRKDERNN